MNELKPEKRAELKRLLAAGCSHRAIADTLGVSKATTVRYSKMWALNATCGCGKRAGHSGWCHVRLDYSPCRRGWLAKRWKKRADSGLAKTVDAAIAAAKALRHDLGRFVWGASGAASIAFATCRVCGKSVRVFVDDAQWERYQDWPRFAGGAVQVRCQTTEERAAAKAAQQEKRQWREAKRTLVEVKRILRAPSRSRSGASTPAANSPR